MIDLVEKGAERVGGLVKLADLLGIRHQSFYSWQRVPAERVLAFEAATGISRHEQRPDLFGPMPTPSPYAPVPQDADRVSTAGAAGDLAAAPAFSGSAA